MARVIHSHSTDTTPSPGFSLALLLNYIISFVFIVIESVLGLRVIFRLFGANPGTGFVQWVYDVSASLMQPFSGIFPTAQIEGGFAIDFSAIFAMLIYAILWYLISLFARYLVRVFNREE